MVEENATKNTPAQKVEKEAMDKSTTNLKHVISSPQFMKLKEILQENQRLIKPVDNEREKEHAGYKVLEEILNKSKNERGV